LRLSGVAAGKISDSISASPAVGCREAADPFKAQGLARLQVNWATGLGKEVP